jgi:hypothetical protein
MVSLKLLRFSTTPTGANYVRRITGAWKRLLRMAFSRRGWVEKVELGVSAQLAPPIARARRRVQVAPHAIQDYPRESSCKGVSSVFFNDSRRSELGQYHNRRGKGFNKLAGWTVCILILMIVSFAYLEFLIKFMYLWGCSAVSKLSPDVLSSHGW